MASSGSANGGCPLAGSVRKLEQPLEVVRINDFHSIKVGIWQSLWCVEINFKKCFTRSAARSVGIALLGACLFVTSAQADGVQGSAASAPQAQAAPAGPNAVTRAAVGKNILKCASRVEQVSSFLGYGANAGALLMAAPQDGDNRIAPLLMEAPTPEGVAYVSATFAPNQSNGCGATYDAVMYWPKSCEAVASQQFEKLRRVGMLKKDIAVLDGGTATKVLLMPAGSGCVSIKKEVVL
jgi:hypothetical protein